MQVSRSGYAKPTTNNKRLLIHVVRCNHLLKLAAKKHTRHVSSVNMHMVARFLAVSHHVRFLPVSVSEICPPADNHLACSIIIHSIAGTVRSC